MNEPIFFWVTWALISSWVLKNFYFTFDDKKIDKLRKTVFGIDLSVLVLFFLPWLDMNSRGISGWELIMNGNFLVFVLFILIMASAVIFLTKEHELLKIGASSHVIASVLFIVTMVRLMPETFILTINSIAPIIASLLLLVGNVIVLLLWQQLQLKEKAGKRKRK